MAKGKTYISGEHLKTLRNRTYIQKVVEDQRIDFQGAWKVEIYQMSDQAFTIADGGGNEFPVPPGALASIFNVPARIVFDGVPEICRDDIIQITFERNGEAVNEAYVIFHRIVPAEDDIIYPVNQYDQ